jgi:hypothetical protein
MDDPILTIRNKGVQILLNRMESNPEEFTARPNRTLTAENRWEWVIDKVINRIDNNHKNTDNYRMQLRFLTNEEVEALYDKYMSIQGEAFTRAIMQELLEEANEREQEANIVRSNPMMLIKSALNKTLMGEVSPTPGQITPISPDGVARF